MPNGGFASGNLQTDVNSLIIKYIKFKASKNPSGFDDVVSYMFPPLIPTKLSRFSRFDLNIFQK